MKAIFNTIVCHKRSFGFIIVLMVILRLAGLGLGGKLAWRDGDEMVMIAQRIVDGYGYSNPYVPPEDSPTAVVPPLYVWVLSGVLYLFGSEGRLFYLAIQLLNIALQAGTVWIMMIILRRKIGPRPALLYGLLFAVSPSLILVSGQAWETALTHLLLTLLAAIIILYWEAPVPLYWFILTGGLMGLISLSNPGWTLCWPFIGLLGLWRLFRWDIKKMLLPGLLLIMGFAAVAAPWTVRNYREFDKFLFVRSMVGPEMFCGNHPDARGGHGRGFTQYQLLYRKDLAEKLEEMGETAYDQWMWQRSREAISSDLPGYIKKCGLRVIMFWMGDFDRIHLSIQRGSTTNTILLLMLSLYLSVETIAGLWGWAVNRQARQIFWILGVYCLVMPLPYYLIIVGFRFRAALSPFMLVWVTMGILRILEKWTDNEPASE